MSDSSSAELVDTVAVALDDVEGEIVTRLGSGDPETTARHLMDPAAAARTVHWGRNYLYETAVEVNGSAESVVVKCFRNSSFEDRLKRWLRGSKALRTWTASLAMRAAGLPVPEPLALLESRDLGGPSYFVSKAIEAMEARYLFRAMNDGTESELFPDVDVDGFLDELGALLRRMHDRDFWHRDVSPGNVLRVHDPFPGEPELVLLDLNRMRSGRRLTRSERMRDLSRLPLFRFEHQRRLLDAYRGESTATAPTSHRGMRLYLFYHRGFLARNRAKKAVRSTFARLARVVPRSTHAHIPPADPAAGARDRIVWDHLTDQPHQHAGRLSKTRVRVIDSGSHLRGLAQVARVLPPTLLRYRRLHREATAVGRTIEATAPGISVVAGTASIADLERLLEGLESRRVLLRLHPWEEDFDESEKLAARLLESGYEVALSVPQNRDLVRDPVRWRAVLEEIDERFLDAISTVEVGHAINRSKWGVWNPGEYRELLAVAQDVLRNRAGVRLAGPAVIDFEFHQTAMALQQRADPLPFDIVSSLLYVDRRGAPENRQAGLDTVAKMALLKAVIETSPHAGRPSWITEVNWPLHEGPHSPAGRAVSVDEEAQASFLVRYFLLGLGSGLVERIYWWQLIARGYGLAWRSTSIELRSAFRAFAQLARALAEARWIRTLHSDDPRVRLFALDRDDGSVLVVGWANVTDGTVPVRLEGEIRSSFDRDGARIDVGTGPDVVVGSAPIYFELRDHRDEG